MNSLQTRLVVSVAIVFAIGFLLASLAIYGFSKTSMYAEFDESMYSKAQALAALTVETDDGVQFALTEGFEEFVRKESPSYFQFWLDGDVFQRSTHLSQVGMAKGSGSLTSPHYVDILLPDGRSGRQVCFTFEPRLSLNDEHDELDLEDLKASRFALRDSPNFEELESARQKNADAKQRASESGPNLAGPNFSDPGVFTLSWEREPRQVTIAVARTTQAIEQRLANLLWILPAVGSAITLLSSCMLIFVVRHGLKPVALVTQAITQIDENSLGERVPTKKVPSEITPLVGRLNDLLGRLEGAFHRERAFSSNLAHELRTPLAGLKSTLEVHLSKLHKAEEYQDAMTTCLQICDQSENLVENLLTLARVESGSFSKQAETINVEDVFRECWQPLSDDAASKGLRTKFELPHRQLSTDREMLRVVIRNVLSNAVSHCDRRGTIEASLTDGVDSITIEVCNSGNTLTRAQATRVFDRLWRGDQARGHTGEHFGLGLTLAKRFVEALGGSVQVTVGELFRISISLPV